MLLNDIPEYKKIKFYKILYIPESRYLKYTFRQFDIYTLEEAVKVIYYDIIKNKSDISHYDLIEVDFPGEGINNE